MTRFGLLCFVVGLVATAGAWAQTRAPLPHWAQLDDGARKTLTALLASGYEVRAAFVNSREMEIAYLEKGSSLYRCIVGGANLELLSDNELVCAPFVEPFRTK